MLLFLCWVCFLPLPFRKKSWGKKKQTQPAPWEDFDQKLHAGKSRAPLRNTYLRFAYSMLGNSTTHFLLNGGHCWWWFIMAQSLNNHLWTKQIQVITKTKLQMGHLNSIFFWLFFSEDQNVLTSDLTSIPCITHHIEPQCHPPRSAHARCLENLRVDLTLARPPVFAEKLSATHQLAWRICFKNAFFGEKRPFFWSGRFWKKELNGIRKIKNIFTC